MGAGPRQPQSSSESVNPNTPIRTSFLPVIINPDLRPEILQAADPRFADMVDYMEWASEGFPHRFAVEGNEVTISA